MRARQTGSLVPAVVAGLLLAVSSTGGTQAPSTPAAGATAAATAPEPIDGNWPKDFKTSVGTFTVHLPAR